MALVRWTRQDLKQMSRLGIAPQEVARQLNLFRHPPDFLVLSRPAQVGDGIFRLGARERKRALKKYAEASGKGRFQKFVPASGAASRMFHTLIKFLQVGDLDPREIQRRAGAGDRESAQLLLLMKALPRMAFFEELKRALQGSGMSLERLRTQGRYREILKALLLPEGLDYSQKPKALISFHRAQGEARTALAEQLMEAVRTVRDDSKQCRIHFTVSKDHLGLCRKHAEKIRKKYEKGQGVQ